MQLNICVDGIIEMLQKNGGITVYFYELLKRLSLNNDIKLHYLSYNDHGNISRMLGGLVTDDNHVAISRRTAKVLERYRSVDVKIKDAIFHSTYYRLPSYRNKKIVTTVHDFTYEKYRSGVARRVHCAQKYRAIRASDHVICVSQNTANDLQRYCPISPERISVVYNGVSESYKPLSSMRNHQPRSVVFVGSRGGYKNFDKVVLALRNDPELSLVIVGGGPLNPLEKAFLVTNIGERYRYLSYLTDDELNAEYNSALCLAYPSEYEGFGIPIVESMKAGCPVVAIGKSSIPEVAGDSAILLKNAEHGSILDAIQSLKSDEIRGDYVQRGLQQSFKFSWDKTYKETAKVYAEL